MTALPAANVIKVAGQFDIPQSRAALRLHLAAAQCPPLLIGRAVAAFTGLCEALFKCNEGQSTSIYFTFNRDGQILLYGQTPIKQNTLHELQIKTTTLRSLVDEFSIQPEQDLVCVSIRLYKRQGNK